MNDALTAKRSTIHFDEIISGISKACQNPSPNKLLITPNVRFFRDPYDELEASSVASETALKRATDENESGPESAYDGGEWEDTGAGAAAYGEWGGHAFEATAIRDMDPID